MQVVTGGHYDVDVILTDPTRNVLYKQIKKQYDSHTWTAAKTGGLSMWYFDLFGQYHLQEFGMMFNNL